MDTVSVRELRNHGGEVLKRVERGERLVVTRDGEAVAELRPLPHRTTDPAELIRRASTLPKVDLIDTRGDLDTAIDPSL